MKNFNKMIEEQIKKFKDVDINNKDELQIQYQQDLDALENELIYERIEELYHNFFIDNTLVKIIENRIKKITCLEDKIKPFEVEIAFCVYRDESFSTILYNDKNEDTSYVKGIYVNTPEIGNTLSGIDSEDFTDEDMYLISNVLPKYILVNNLPYFSSWNFETQWDYNYDEYKILNFTSTLEELIKIYYIEKQRQEYLVNSNKYLVYKKRT